MKSLLDKKSVLKRYALTGSSLLLIMFNSFSINAAQYQSHNSIHQAAKKFMQNYLKAEKKGDVSVETGKLDSRLKLNRCERALTAYLPKGSRSVGKTAVGVKCAGKRPWSLHIPVTVNHYRQILVTAVSLKKGDLVHESDVKFIRKNVSQLPYGYLDSIEGVKGLKIKRRVTTGAILTPSMLKRPQIISRGQQVAIIANSGRMTVRVDGKALANGAVGDRIKVMNLKSKQKLEGVITASGQVEVSI